MSDSAPAIKSDYFDRNMRALTGVNPAAAAFLRETAPVDGAVAANGRDGASTFTWRDSDGQLRWLGRSSMPTISTPALLDAFQPGQGNSLLVDIGHGEEVRQLAARLAPHQAVFVVIEHPAAAVLALRLHDLSSEIEAGRVVLCAGPAPWADLTAVLVTHAGYLVPDRVLCRPWYESSFVGELSRRLERLSQDVDGLRNQSPIRATEAGPGFRIAFVSNALDPAIVRLADSLENAAIGLGWQCRRHTLATPKWVHPAAIEADLRAFQPDICLVIGAAVGSLAYALPDCPTAVVCTHGLGLSEEWLGKIPDAVSIVARSQEQIGQLRAAGIEAARLLLWPPAARARPSAATPGACDQVLALCDGLDASPKAVGLNLDTHQKLWHESQRLIASQADTYTDDDAASILRSAARRLGITLTSEEVIDGLVSRIRAVLGPATVRESVLSRLHSAGLPIQIYGAGKFTDEKLAPHHRGPWPDPHYSAQIAAQCRAAISIETGSHLPDGLLDCAAAGARLFQRVAVSKHDAVQFAGIDAVATGVISFRSAADLARQLRQPIDAGSTPGGNSVRAFLVNAHMWTHRLNALRHHLQVAVSSQSA